VSTEKSSDCAPSNIISAFSAKNLQLVPPGPNEAMSKLEHSCSTSEPPLNTEAGNRRGSAAAQCGKPVAFRSGLFQFLGGYASSSEA